MNTLKITKFKMVKIVNFMLLRTVPAQTGLSAGGLWRRTEVHRQKGSIREAPGSQGKSGSRPDRSPASPSEDLNGRPSLPEALSNLGESRVYVLLYQKWPTVIGDALSVF